MGADRRLDPRRVDRVGTRNCGAAAAVRGGRAARDVQADRVGRAAPQQRPRPERSTPRERKAADSSGHASRLGRDAGGVPPACRHTCAPSATTRTAATTKTYTVVRYDTLWGLAEKHLGDPLRWREIFELNLGKRQPDGRSLEDPQLIIPGWVLTLPADATGVNEETAVPAPVTTPSAPVVTHHTPPHHSRPAVAPSTTVPSTSPAVPAPTATAAPLPRPSEPSEHHSERGIDPALLIGGGLAAASLVALLDRLRRVQRRRRRAGRPIPSTSPDLEQVERRLRSAADLADAELLDLALRAFASGVATSKAALPAILAVRIGGGQVEILTDRAPDRPPKGFVATDDARGWITDPDLSVDDLRSLGSGACAPLPALVALGDIDGGRLLVDVESAGTLTVDGAPERVSAFIRRLTVELATSTWVDHVDVLAVGATDIDIIGAQRVTHFPDIDAALDDLEAAALTFAAALAVRPLRTHTRSARVGIPRRWMDPDDPRVYRTHRT